MKYICCNSSHHFTEVLDRTSLATVALGVKMGDSPQPYSLENRTWFLVTAFPQFYSHFLLSIHVEIRKERILYM